jgi:hypothetical protein
MAAAETIRVESEQERIERWRAAELERAGYEPAAASLLPSSLCRSCSSSAASPSPLPGRMRLR